MDNKVSQKQYLDRGKNIATLGPVYYFEERVRSLS